MTNANGTLETGKQVIKAESEKWLQVKNLRDVTTGQMQQTVNETMDQMSRACVGTMWTAPFGSDVNDLGRGGANLGVPTVL